MTSATPIALVRAAVQATKAAVAAVCDPVAITPSAAVELYEEYDRLARAAGAAKLVLAQRVDASDEARRRGLRTTAELLARVGGTSLGAAKRELETSEALTQLPQTQRALLGGQVSPEQGKIVAGAAKADPSAERELLIKAKTANQRELLEEAQRVKAAADRDAEETHARIHRERRAGQFIRRMAERSRDLHLGGGGQPGTRRQPAPQHLALLRLDLEALWRGHVEGEELCEITGLGPIPAAMAKVLLDDAVLKLIITKGVDVLNVTSLTRRRTQAMHYASLWTSPTCVAEGCSRTIVEYDHRTGAEWKDTHHTRLQDLDRLCCGHHNLHTSQGWALVEGTGKRPMVGSDDPRHPANAPP